MKFTTFLKKNRFILLILIALFLVVASYFLFFKKENFQQNEYYSQDQCHESRAECNNSDYPDVDIWNISSDWDNQDLRRVCFKKCSLVPDQNGNYPFSDSDKDGGICIVRDENAPRNPDGTRTYSSGERPFIPATCNPRQQCTRVSCPSNTTLFTYGGMNFVGANNETTLEGEIISNNTCVRSCEERSGLEMSQTDTSCNYYDPTTGDVESVSKSFSKPTCDQFRAVELRGVRYATTSCSYRTQGRTLASYRANMKCPLGYTLDTFTDNGMVAPRCTKMVNKVSNRCPNGTVPTVPASNRCRQYTSPTCRDTRETFDKKTNSCLKGRCRTGVLYDKKCVKCSGAGYSFNKTTNKCEKTGSVAQNPTRTDPICYSK